MLVNIAAFAFGMTAGVRVTKRLHNDPDAGKWGERLGTTRLRFANLPVGGTIALTAASLLPPAIAGPVRFLGAGAVMGAVGWGLADPLPPLASVTT
ncbi:MAG: hypothetical protein M3331_03195 [Actinomycetota bacterium]|nr:hypothetical protein [Actinomycetota bacterium]